MLQQLKIAFLVLFLAQAIGYSCTQAQIVHAILCAPTEYQADKSEQKNKDTQTASEAGLLVVKAFLDRLPQDNLNLTIHKGKDYNEEKILSTIRNLRTSKNDTVFVYIIAHGNFSAEKRFNFLLNNHPTPSTERHKITAEIRRHDVRLGVFITESCGSIASNSDMEQMERIFRRTKGDIVQYRTGAPPELIDNLFLRESGFVDFLAASAGEGASFSAQTGPFFTSNLEKSIYKNLDARLTWDSIFLQSKRLTQIQTGGSQTPLALATPSVVKRNYVMFDMAVEGFGGKVRIAEVDQGGNIEQIGLKKGDFILGINDKRISTTGEYLYLVDKIPRNSDVQFDILRDGVTFRRSLNLNR